MLAGPVRVVANRFDMIACLEPQSSGSRFVRPKKPTRASIDQVQITREGTVAVIEFADPNIMGVNLTLGEAVHGMTDQKIVEVHNDIVAAQEQSLCDWDNTVFEIPAGKPQLKLHCDSGQWVPEGDVLRCIIEDNERGEAVIIIDDNELSLAEFGQMLTVHAGWGMRIAFVPEVLIHEQPKVKVGKLRRRRR